MMRKLDCIFISYDEPNADANYEHLLSICPTAKRVHGVKGFDSAHKAAARLSTTDYFITVDADSMIDPIFFDREIDLSIAEQHVFAVRNIITGLSSGNGSVKVWLKEAVLTKQTHEHANNLGDKLDFCQQFISMYYLDRSYGVTYPNQNRELAFRSGFRESLKCSLTYLNKDDSNPSDFIKQLCRNSVEVLCSVGMDARYGIYSILGANVAALFATDPPEWFDYSRISDYAQFNEFCSVFTENLNNYEAIIAELSKDKYREAAALLDVQPKLLSVNESIWFKSLRTFNAVPLIFMLHENLPLHEIKSYVDEIFFTTVVLLSPHDSTSIYHIINKG